MKNFHVIILFLSVTINVYGQSTKSTKITGGFEVDISERPFQVSLQGDNGHFCGGSIVNNRWILTAAHCVNGSNPDDLQIAVGITNQGQVGVQG